MKLKIIASMLIIGIALTGCSNNDDDDNNNDVTVNSTPQFTGTVNGTAVSFIQGTANINSGGGWDLDLGATENIIYQSYLYNIASSTTIINFNKGTMTYNPGDDPTYDEFKAYFAAGNYAYSTGAVNGVEVAYFDANGDEWSTAMGSGNQTGSTFHIDESIEQMNGFGKYVKVKISFSCKLYNAAGTSITLTNGVYVGTFQHYE